jgi:hypothetical protein
MHIEHICTFFVTFFSATIDDRNLIFGHKLHIGMPYCGKRFWTHQIPTSCLPTLLIFIHIVHICSFFVAFFSATINGRNLMIRPNLHIGTQYCGKCFYTPAPLEGVYCFTSVLPSVCLSFRPSQYIFVAFFSATIDGRNLIFGHKLHIQVPHIVGSGGVS